MLNNQERRELMRKFGKIFIEHVRDSTFKEIHNMSLGTLKDEKNEKLASAFSKLSEKDRESIKELSAYAVDTTIANILYLFDQHCLDLSKLNNFVIQLIYSENGEYFDINDRSDGLVGELHTEDGWIAQFSAYDNSIETW
ncbi:MAG: hypothetical protein LBE12_19570 [Planctomycetaceae bacterium]|jgi:hypothetical protein|nr:hypothetical protein [Planctomycetaceae bacterium]